MFVTKISARTLEKARRSGKLVPEKRTIQRGGSTYQATVWIDPTNKTSSAQHGFDFDEEQKKPERAKPSYKVRKYYITMAREGQKEHAWLVGPFGTQEAAQTHVEEARRAASKVDPWSDFDSFGTASYESEEGTHIKGKLNNLMSPETQEMLSGEPLIDRVKIMKISERQIEFTYHGETYALGAHADGFFGLKTRLSDGKAWYSYGGKLHDEESFQDGMQLVNALHDKYGKFDADKQRYEYADTRVA